MPYANDFDVDFYLSRFVDSTRGLELQDNPNLARAAINLARLRDWTDSVSDGWIYWPKPQRSAQRLIQILDEAHGRQVSTGRTGDITTSELRKALTPIKAMLTRIAKQGVSIRHGGGPVLLDT